jgi:hypothetical protein
MRASSASRLARASTPIRRPEPHKASPKPIAIIANLMPPAVKWKTFFKRQVGHTG